MAGMEKSPAKRQTRAVGGSRPGLDFAVDRPRTGFRADVSLDRGPFRFPFWKVS